MRLLEDQLKPMLSDCGIAVPEGALASDRARCAWVLSRHERVVVKALSGENDRAADGQVVLADADEVEAVLTAGGAWGHPIWVEQAVRHEDEFFVGVVWSGECDEPVLLVGRGGSGVERRGASEVAQIPVNGPLAVPPDDSPFLRDWPQLVDIAARTVGLFEKLDAISLELNPVVPDEEGRLVALDAKAFVDPYGHYGGVGGDEERSDQPLIEFVELDGGVGVVSLGAGLTRALIDWLEELGAPAACFSDLIPAVLADASHLLQGEQGPECERAVDWLCRWLVRGDAHALLVNLVSGGTPIDALSRSVLAGIDSAGWSGRVVPFVGGNQSARARELWEREGFVPAATFEDALRRTALPS